RARVRTGYRLQLRQIRVCDRQISELASDDTGSRHLSMKPQINGARLLLTISRWPAGRQLGNISVLLLTGSFRVIMNRRAPANLVGGIHFGGAPSSTSLLTRSKQRIRAAKSIGRTHVFRSDTCLMLRQPSRSDAGSNRLSPAAGASAGIAGAAGRA